MAFHGHQLTPKRRGRLEVNRWPGFLDIEEFKSALSRELALVERNGHRLSLLSFSLSSKEKDAACRLGALLDASTRLTDEMGWLDDNHMAVILPFTSAEGAEKLLSRVRSKLSPNSLFPPSFISTYPPGDSAPSADGFYGTPSVPNIRDYVVPIVPSWKTALDLSGAVLGLILLSPLLVLIAVAIKCSSGGPVIFKQERLGLRGEPFMLWKFRTMAEGAATQVHAEHFSDLIDTDRPMAKLDSAGDTRVTRLGRILRKPGLDELPQLVNVLRREMSLVGPRPCIRYEAEKYKLWQTDRFDTPPGMTGLWQVSGKNKTSFNEMLRLDLNYVRQRSPLLDLTILLKTPFLVLKLAVDRCPQA